MKKMEHAVDALENFLLNEAKKMNNEDCEKLEKIYFAIKTNLMIVDDKMTELLQDNSKLDQELEEKKEIIWSNSILRKGIISRAFDAAYN